MDEYKLNNFIKIHRVEKYFMNREKRLGTNVTQLRTIWLGYLQATHNIIKVQGLRQIIKKKKINSH